MPKAIRTLIEWVLGLFASKKPTQPEKAPEPAKPTKTVVVKTPVTDFFGAALKEVLKYEGGKDDDPYDPGGRTAYGVIQRRYNQYRIKKGLPLQDVWKITAPEIREIYRWYYWDPLGCDQYDPAIAFALFNFCVNAGSVQAVRDAQRVLGVDVDGMLGPKTYAALRAIDPRSFVVGYAERQRIFYPKLKTFWRFGKGWMQRVDDAEKFALSVL